jgi:chaperonin cofactor prefoldin
MTDMTSTPNTATKAKDHLESLEKVITDLERQIQHEREQRQKTESELKMWVAAWIRETNGLMRRPKIHLIDELVSITRSIREKADQYDSIQSKPVETTKTITSEAKRRQWRNLVNKATQGRWKYIRTENWRTDDVTHQILHIVDEVDCPQGYNSTLAQTTTSEDAAFIAEAKEAVPALLDDIDSLLAELKQIKESEFLKRQST